MEEIVREGGESVLEKVSVDILLDISKYLDPQDILTLRAVRRLHDYRRDLWLKQPDSDSSWTACRLQSSSTLSLLRELYGLSNPDQQLINKHFLSLVLDPSPIALQMS
jgi:hypothetical protein